MLVFSIFHNEKPSRVPDDIISECVTVARADSGICIIAKPEAVTMNSTRFSSTIVNLNTSGVFSSSFSTSEILSQQPTTTTFSKDDTMVAPSCNHGGVCNEVEWIAMN